MFKVKGEVVDGALPRIDHTDVVLRANGFPAMKSNHFLMAPYCGPGLLPHAQKLWIDESMPCYGNDGLVESLTIW